MLEMARLAAPKIGNKFLKKENPVQFSVSWTKHLRTCLILAAQTSDINTNTQAYGVVD